MKYFLDKHHITAADYLSMRDKVLNGNGIEAMKDLRQLAGVSLGDAREYILSEFKLEHKLSYDMQMYNCINRIESYAGINDLPISSDLGTLISYAKEQLYLGLNCSSESK